MIQKRKNGYKLYSLKNLILVAIFIFITAIGGLQTQQVYAATCNHNGVCHGGSTTAPTTTAPSTATPTDPNACASSACVDPAISCSSNNCDLIAKYVNPAINLFSVLFGLIAVISIILGGISYTTSEGDPQKSSKAKSRILNTIIAVIAYIFLYAFLQFLVPGGAFNR